MGIRADTHITTNQFGFAGAIFYIGFLAAQVDTYTSLFVF
jgi:hypothetical protein